MKVRDVLKKSQHEKAPKGFNPYIEIGDIDISSKTYSLKEKESVSGAVMAYEGAILISTVRPTRGAITILNESKAAVSNAFAILYVDEDKCLKDFLFFQLNSKKFFEYLGKNSKGATYPTCSKDDVYNYEIVVPSIDKQREIVSTLSLISKIIKEKIKETLLLDELVKARFVELFGDPVNNTKDYEMQALNDVCTKITDGTHDTPERYSEGYLLITGKNIRATGIIYDEVEYVSEEDHRIIYERCNPEYEDVLYTNIGVNYGTACINDLDYEFSMKNVALLKPNRSKVNGYYLWICLNLMRNYILMMNKVGGAQTFMGLATIKKIRIPIPPISLQNDFINVIKQVDKSKAIRQKKIAVYQELLNKKMDEYFNIEEI